MTADPQNPERTLQPQSGRAQSRIFRDYCNTCGAKRGEAHEPRCPWTGEVVAWSGIGEPYRNKEADRA